MSPFTRGGAVSARVRASKHRHVSRIQEIEDARTEVREAIVTAWSRYQAARAQLSSDRTQVQSNKEALSGVREEEKVGQRTLLDVLNAEQELVNSEVQLATTRRDLIVAAYALLSAMGKLSIDNIGVASAVYDPEVHYSEVRRTVVGDFDYARRRASRTRGPLGLTRPPSFGEVVEASGVLHDLVSHRVLEAPPFQL